MCSNTCLQKTLSPFWPVHCKCESNVNKRVLFFPNREGKRSRFMCTLMEIANFYFDVNPSQYMSYSRLKNKIITRFIILKINMLCYNMLNIYFMESFQNLHNESKVYRVRGRSGRRERKKRRNCPRTELSRWCKIWYIK